MPAKPVPELQKPMSEEEKDLQYPSMVVSPKDCMQPQSVVPRRETQKAH